jgi:hypothetical protein
MLESTDLSFGPESDGKNGENRNEHIRDTTTTTEAEISTETLVNLYQTIRNNISRNGVVSMM